MSATHERIKNELIVLVNEGFEILKSELETQAKGQKGTPTRKEGTEKSLPTTSLPTTTAYQSWYTRALPVVRQLLPERYQEFQEQYKLDKRKQIDSLTYTISDYLIGFRVTRDYFNEEVVNHLNIFVAKFNCQIDILRSALKRIDSILADIKGVLEARLFDNELDTATELLQKGHLRAAGALAGVTLESHLSTICSNHNITLKKKEPTISDFNEALKENGTLDIANWRLVQRLGDIRNLCVHKKDREPTREEVDELITGVKKFIKTSF
jgi:hypothetical protein